MSLVDRVHGCGLVEQESRSGMMTGAGGDIGGCFVLSNCQGLTGMDARVGTGLVRGYLAVARRVGIRVQREL